jgi:cytochrome c oxidase cbb3-type subunit 4
MDVTTLRTITTVALFTAFLGVWIWAWSKKRKKRFTEAANLPFADDDVARRSAERVEDKQP